MAKETKGGDAAFPIQLNYPNGDHTWNSGMTKREFMATQILGALIAHPTLSCDARDAVREADKLINALNEGGRGGS